MILSAGTTVAILDGEALKLFRATGDASNLSLTPVEHGAIDDDTFGSGGRHHNSSAEPSDKQIEEDGFVAGAAKLLNAQAQSGKIKSLVVVAAPKALGELRKHYAPALAKIVEGEVSKEMKNATISEILSTLQAA